MYLITKQMGIVTCIITVDNATGTSSGDKLLQILWIFYHSSLPITYTSAVCLPFTVHKYKINDKTVITSSNRNFKVCVIDHLLLSLSVPALLFVGVVGPLLWDRGLLALYGHVPCPLLILIN